MAEGEKPYGFDPRCSTCKTPLLKGMKSICKKCLAPYCSEKCLKKEKKKWCVPLTQEGYISALLEFGYSGDKDIPFEFRGCKYLPFPGPIMTGNLPNTLWLASEGQPKQLKDAITGDIQKSIYYFVAVSDLDKLINHQITHTQGQEIKLISMGFNIEQATKNIVNNDPRIKDITREYYKAAEICALNLLERIRKGENIDEELEALELNFSAAGNRVSVSPSEKPVSNPDAQGVGNVPNDKNP
jgi:hypothetical protein